MRKTLEDLYYGNITPNEQMMAPDSELKKAVDRVTRCESQSKHRSIKEANASRPTAGPSKVCAGAAERSGNTSNGKAAWAGACRTRSTTDTGAIQPRRTPTLSAYDGERPAGNAVWETVSNGKHRIKEVHSGTKTVGQTSRQAVKGADP